MGIYFHRNFVWLFTSLWVAENLGLFKRWRPRVWDYPYTNSYTAFNLWFNYFLIKININFLFNIYYNVNIQIFIINNEIFIIIWNLKL